MIRLLIADDHAIVRNGLKQLLAETTDLQVVDEADCGHAVLEKIRNHQYDMLLTDMSMPGRSGLELIKQVKAEAPKLPILVLSMHQEEQYAMRAFRAGASGYLCKDSATTLLVSAIRKVATGGLYVSPAVAEGLARRAGGGDQETQLHEQLSDREFQIFQLIVAGRALSSIADDLSLSVKTVSTHKTHIMQKLQLSNAADLVRYAIRHGLVEQA
ncbi:response regulator [Methylogaea oryzae]|uniref:DNA-binding response regulator n=1 Tax=Methylogaea oryzae TaxID=1295382 RepID=A0A8D5AH60_9GAMM|nr:response regulator transcription factor [Methylogaea oryzae]BBL71128.1 DNA-binding response regulator [Methylogaea oryzae]